MKKFLLVMVGLLALSTMALSADYTDGDIHKNDYKWFQFNIMQSINNRIPFDNQDDTYLEMEFGGRSGIIELYGYWDIFDILDSEGSDRHEKNGSTSSEDNFFLKFNPKFSVDGMLKKDLSVGPVKEWFIPTLIEVGDGQLWTNFIGVGANVDVPWFGSVSFNAYNRFVKESYGGADEGEWDGYRLSTNWFKPFYFLENGSFIAYQGYVDYDFGMEEKESQTGYTSSSLQTFHGIYWHSDRYSLGYGVKIYNNFTGIKDGESLFGVKQDTSGLGHYLAAIYKF